MGVVAAQLDGGAGFHGGAHRGGEFKPHKVHGRSLFVVLAVQVFVGNGVDAGVAFHFHKHAVFDADQAGQLALAFVDVGVLDHHRGLPVGAIGHQRGIGPDFLLDALFFKDLFNAQHLLDLVAHRQLALEVQRDVVAQVHGAQLAVGHDIGLVLFAVLAVGLQRHEAVAGDLSGDLHGRGVLEGFQRRP